MPDSGTRPPELARTVGLPAAVGFGLGAMVGTGVFVYTGVATGLAGPAVLVSLALAGLAATCNGLSSAELAAVHPRSGGTYEYAGRRLSPWAGFLAGWLFLAAKTTSAAATALGFGAYVAKLAPIPPLAVSALLVAGTTLLGLRPLRRAGAVNLALVAVTVASLVAFIVAEAPRVSLDRFTPFAPRGAGGILSAASLLFVAYAGYGRIATLGEEIDDPKRNIPRALVAALALTALLYLAVTATAVGAIGAEAFAAAAHGGAPLEAAAGTPAVKTALSVGAATAMGAVFLNLVLGISRMAFAMARGGDLPSPLARVRAEAGPAAAVLFTGLAVGILVALGSIVGLVSVSAFTILVYYGLTNLSALRLRRDERLVHPIVPFAGLLFCLTLAASVPLRSLAVGASILGAGVLWRLGLKAIRGADPSHSRRKEAS
ncbi:MAG TPA: APC family permease [Planctomycetota bacterium]|nr:APC family permease [Planctomycetota bacterium]